MPPNTWSRRTVVGLVLVAAVLPFLARALAGPPGGIVHIRWQPTVSSTDRDALEDRFMLRDGTQLDANTWRYDLIDPSTQNIRALVGEPAVADTHNIDRTNGTLDPSAARTMRRARVREGEAIVAGVDILAAALAGLMTIVWLGGAAARTATVRAAGRQARHAAVSIQASWARPILQFIQRGIPSVDATTAGLFRIVFGTATLLYFVMYPVDASWLNRTFDVEIDGPIHQAVIDLLQGHPGIVDLISPALLVTGVAFIAGLFTRVTYSLFVAAVVLWAYVAVSVSSTHPQSILVVTLVALLPSRWGDGLSLDAWRLARSGQSAALAAGPRYGYSVWVPMLTFGVAFAAAAWAKLTVPPGWTTWIANGTVKYHFITDSVNAPVQWGLQLAQHPWLAIVASFLAIATELLVVTAAFVRNDWYRMAMGAGAAALIAGFGVFMGVFWPGWWVPLLAFLPWQRLAKSSEPGSTFRESGLRVATVAQVAMIVAVISQQVVVSAMKLERAPMFSWYDMYSGTYASPAAFAASRPPRFRIVASTNGGAIEFNGCNPHEEFVREFEAAVAGSSAAQTAVWRALRGCGDLTGVRAVVLEGDLNTFDWDQLRFTLTRSARIIGPLAHAGDRPSAQ